jgi:hypothetical protein
VGAVSGGAGNESGFGGDAFDLAGFELVPCDEPAGCEKTRGRGDGDGEAALGASGRLGSIGCDGQRRRGVVGDGFGDGVESAPKVRGEPVIDVEVVGGGHGRVLRR